MWYWPKVDKYTNGTKERAEVDSSTYGNMVNNRIGITNQWEEDELY